MLYTLLQTLMHSIADSIVIDYWRVNFMKEIFATLYVKSKKNEKTTKLAEA